MFLHLFRRASLSRAIFQDVSDWLSFYSFAFKPVYESENGKSVPYRVRLRYEQKGRIYSIRRDKLRKKVVSMSLKKKGPGCVRIVHISDTHMRHHELKAIPDGDVLIHSGDFLDSFQKQDFAKCAREIDCFFAKLPHKHKIFVAGNHERCFKGRHKEEISKQLSHVIYLQDDFVIINGVKIYGSPWNIDRGSVADAFVASTAMLQSLWSKIPADTDVLVTHNPPYGIWDRDGAMGCKYLRDEVLNRIRPRAHLFGHTHTSGSIVIDGTVFSNAACYYSSMPRIIDIQVDPSKETTSGTIPKSS